jgi:1,4-alpha-glucan branching enzyme
LYGEPNEAKRFIDQCHEADLTVILDVVYNHVGEDGNYFPFFSPSYFTDRYQTEWGKPFQGEEFAASTPFLYFADQPPEIAGRPSNSKRPSPS